jgi:hypothetical protein
MPTGAGLSTERKDEPMSAAGVWKIGIATPIGTQTAILELTEHDGAVAGVVKNDTETMPLLTPVLRGDRLTWCLTIARPMRLNLAFEVTIDGDTLSGTAKAGILPASRVTGTRVSGPPQAAG